MRLDLRPARRALLVLSAVLLPLLTISCKRSGGSSAPPSETVVAEGIVGPSGGTLRVSNPNSALVGTEIIIPAGALNSTESIQIVATQKFPQLQAAGTPALVRDVPQTILGVSLRPRTLTLAAPATVTIRYTKQYEDQMLARFLISFTPRQDLADDLAVFARTGMQPTFRLVSPVSADSTDRSVVFTTLALGDFFAMHPFLYAALYQNRKLIDPAVPLKFLNHNGLLFEDPAGTQSISVGHGSLAAFFTGNASQNVIVIHGLGSSPLEFMGVDDFLPADPARGLRQLLPNVIAYQYPTTRSVIENANHLYDLIHDQMKAGFSCNIVAHSMGGLVARYMMEQSHKDPRRAGFQNGDPTLANRVRSLVTVGTPHEGASLANTVFSVLGLFDISSDPRLFNGISDLRQGAGSFTGQLNSLYKDNSCRYFFLAGDVGAGTDLVVGVDSATLAIPLSPPETFAVFSGVSTLFEHGQLHTSAAQNGVLQAVFQVLTLP